MHMFWKLKKPGNIWKAPIRNFGLKLSSPLAVHRMTSIGWSTARCDSNLATSAKTRRWNRASCVTRVSRLKHMDELGVDVQVIFPTMFIIPLTARPEIELALGRSYNRWMADIWKQAKERLRWAAVLPLLSIDKVFEEAKFAKENGACGIFLRGSECERLLSDSYFFPAL